MVRNVTSHAGPSDRIKVASSLCYEAGPAKIRIKNLTKEFHTRDKTFTAIDDVSLDIAPGTFFMIVGPSGCGKTTLLRILAGLDKPTCGSIEINQTDRSRPCNSMVFQGDSICWYWAS